MNKTMLYTIGYQGHDQDTFQWMLKTAGVQVLVDVRESPVSRNPDFAQDRLKQATESSGLEYVHVPQLGGPAELRRELRRTQDLGSYFSAYRKHLARQRGSLKALYELACRKASCLLCYERKADECHRSIVAEALEKLNGDLIAVKHL